MNYAKGFKKIREYSKKSLEEMAQGSGIDVDVLDRIEKGITIPNKETVFKLARFIDPNADENITDLSTSLEMTDKDKEERIKGPGAIVYCACLEREDVIERNRNLYDSLAPVMDQILQIALNPDEEEKEEEIKKE